VQVIVASDRLEDSPEWGTHTDCARGEKPTEEQKGGVVVAFFSPGSSSAAGIFCFCSGACVVQRSSTVHFTVASSRVVELNAAFDTALNISTGFQGTSNYGRHFLRNRRSGRIAIFCRCTAHLMVDLLKVAKFAHS
jgi:hypothetical protein